MLKVGQSKSQIGTYNQSAEEDKCTEVTQIECRNGGHGKAFIIMIIITQLFDLDSCDNIPPGKAVKMFPCKCWPSP